MLSVLLPGKAKTATWEDLETAWNKLESVISNPETDNLKAEFLLWQTKWKMSNTSETDPVPITAIAALNMCNPVTYPTIHQLLKILASLPVSNAEPERCFSKVERTMTSLRSTMTEDRLEALILLQAHRDRLPDTDRVIEHFATSGVRRLKFSFRI